GERVHGENNDSGFGSALLRRRYGRGTRDAATTAGVSGFEPRFFRGCGERSPRENDRLQRSRPALAEIWGGAKLEIARKTGHEHCRPDPGRISAASGGGGNQKIRDSRNQVCRGEPDKDEDAVKEIRILTRAKSLKEARNDRAYSLPMPTRPRS